MVFDADLESMIFIISHFLMFPMDRKQQLLEEDGLRLRTEGLLELLEAEIEMIAIEDNIHVAVKERVEKSQKQFYLKEKIKAIQEELGDGTEYIDEAAEYQSQDRTIFYVCRSSEEGFKRS